MPIIMLRTYGQFGQVLLAVTYLRWPSAGWYCSTAAIFAAWFHQSQNGATATHVRSNIREHLQVRMRSTIYIIAINGWLHMLLCKQCHALRISLVKLSEEINNQFASDRTDVKCRSAVESVAHLIPLSCTPCTLQNRSTLLRSHACFIDAYSRNPRDIVMALMDLSSVETSKFTGSPYRSTAAVFDWVIKPCRRKALVAN